MFRTFSFACASIVRGREIAAFEAVDLGAPANAAKVVYAVGNSEVRIHVHVAFAVVIAVLLSANASSPATVSLVANSLVKSTVPEVVALQYARDIVAADQYALHAPIDADLVLVGDRHEGAWVSHGYVQVVIE